MRDVQINGDKRIIMPMDTEQPNPHVPAEASQDEYVSLRHLLGVLRRRLLVIALVTVLLVASVVGFDLLRTPVYEAEIKLLVGQEQIEGERGNLGSDVQGLQKLTQTVAEVAHTRTVANAVIQRLDLRITSEEFLENMIVEQAAETQVIDVSYRDLDPERAQQVANAIGAVFSDQVSEVSPSANAVTATVWEAAVLPESPVSPNPLRDGILALILGAILGAGLAFLLEELDDRWRSPEEVEQVSGVPTFGVIRAFEAARSKTRNEKKGSD